MSTILKDLSWRYATKKFDASKKLSEAQINLLKEGFNLSASSFGLQPVSLLVIGDKNLKSELVKHSMDQLQVADASHLLVFCIQKNVDAIYVKKYFDRVKEVRHTPDEILKPFKDYLMEQFVAKEQVEMDAWATKQAYLAMGNLLTICAVEKIDACPMEGFVPSEYDKVLKLEDKGLQSVLIMPVGYRAEDDDFASLKKVRKPIEQAVIEY